jgi:hypothetical protein
MRVPAERSWAPWARTLGARRFARSDGERSVRETEAAILGGRELYVSNQAVSNKARPRAGEPPATVPLRLPMNPLRPVRRA